MGQSILVLGATVGGTPAVEKAIRRHTESTIATLPRTPYPKKQGQGYPHKWGNTGVASAPG